MNEQEIFSAALEQGPGCRAAFLNSACAGDVDLRRRVESLLQCHGQDAAFFEKPAAEILATDPSPPMIEPGGTLIGPYKLLEQIGEGGMGLVYMAEQQQPVRRLVALKLVKPGMDSKQVIARFEAERQALAMMDHPNIARIYDAGTVGQVTSASDWWLEGNPKSSPALVTSTSHSSGRPYFVMELVRGIPINEFCDQQKLAVRPRLELFISVCQAVQHAHQKGIIHRDLKPTNVLVTHADAVPLPKVIDFGIAKALGPALTDHTLHTGFAQLVGTPMYMSPEQAQMNHFGVDTRSDVYSLGVLLYELLTGTTPFNQERLSKAGLDEMRRMIREEEPETVSARIARTRTEQPRVDAGVNRRAHAAMAELDWIVMKALEKDRSRRYESASALAADIQRYLSDEPVLACPPTTMYRFQKFARKHKPALATAAAIGACFLLGSTVSAWQAVRATTAEAQANANEQKANTQRDEAQRQRDEIKGLYDKLGAKEQQLQRTLYASNMNLAQHAWKGEGGAARVRDLLEQHRPKPGEADLRGFEWFYLYRMSHSELFTIHGATYRLGGGDLAFSPDSKRLAGDDFNDNTVKVWDTQSGKELLTIARGKGPVAFSPDGKRLATGVQDGDSGEFKVWDADTGREILSLKGHTSRVETVAFSPDGKRLATSAGDKTVRVWDAENGMELVALNGSFYGVAFSPDGKRLTSAAENRIKVLDAETGQEFLSLRGDGGRFSYSSDRKRLASGRQVWDAQTGKVLLSLKRYVESVALSPDGKHLACADAEEEVIKVRDAQSGEELHSYKGHTGVVSRVLFSPDGTRLASRSRDGSVKVWDATTSQEARTIGGATLPMSGVSFSPDGKRVAFGTWGTWDNKQKAYTDREVKVADVQTGQEIISLKGHTKDVNVVAYSPNGKRVASGSSDLTVRVWDLQTGREFLTFKGHTAEVVSVAYSPDGKRLASCSSVANGINGRNDPGEPGEVKVWDAETGRELLTLQGHTRFVNYVTFSPDGQRLATLSRDQTIRIWNAQSGQEIFSLKATVSVSGSVAFSPDGKRLANSDTYSIAAPGSSGRREVMVRDAQTGEELLTLRGLNTRLVSVLYSPDGKRLVTSTGGGPPALGQVKVWDAETGHELLTLEGHSRLSHDLAFSPDGTRLAGKGRDGYVKIWDATPLPEKP